ncbi:MAG TPA: hypothetical protein VIV12_23155 [Streptosporangiaceae bacterium]
MTSQEPRLTRPGELPAPRTGADSAAVLAEATDTLAALRTPTGSATARSACTPWPASSTRPSR